MKRNKVFAVLCGAMMLCTTAFVSCGDEEEKEDKGDSRYAVKSKITSENSSAAALCNAVNAAIIEMDDEGIDTKYFISVSYNKGDDSVSLELDGKSSGEGEEKMMYEKISDYFNDVEKLDFEAKFYSGTCVAVACKENDTYTGSKPVVVTIDNYKDYSDDLEKALEDAVKKANG